MLSITSFLGIAVVGLVFVVFLPIWWLVPFDLAQISYFGTWVLGTLRLSPNDLMVLLIFAAILLRSPIPARKLARLDLIWPWLALGILLSISYVVAPINQRTLTDPIRYVYQVATYCWRPILYFPICLILLRSPRKAYAATNFILIAGLIVAIEAIQQGYAGWSSAPGPFKTGNQLGGVLIIPTVLAFCGALMPRDRVQLVFSGTCLILFLRAFLFCGSRGGQMATAAGFAFFGSMLVLRHVGRKRLRFLTPFALAGILALLPAVPIIMSRPTIAHAASVTEGSKASTMQWRMQQRWPHFWQIALDNPLFGIGTAVDTRLGKTANTPHNGFLSMLVTYGFPAFLLLVFFAFRGVYNGLQIFLHAPNPDHKVFGLSMAAAIVGILVHQMVEVTLTAPFPFKVFWMMVALTELARRWPDHDEHATVDDVAPKRAEAPEDWFQRWWLHRPRPRPAAARDFRAAIDSTP